MASTLLTVCKLFILCMLQYISASTAEEISPLHVDIKDGTVKPASVSITWNCNITEEMKKYNYHVEIKYLTFKQQLTLNIQDCSKEIFIDDLKRLTLHKGVDVKITADNGNAENTKWTAIYPEGENQTSAENVNCILNISLLNCSWDFGKKAPNDTIYSLWLYQHEHELECEHYKTNLTARQMQCSFRAPKIEYLSITYLLVKGSSNTTSILFHGEWISLAAKEILNPPRNIQMNVSDHNVEIKWKEPETRDTIPANCFSYEISLKDKTKDKIYHVRESLHFISDEFSSSHHFEMKMKAQKTCSHEKYSTWSETFRFDPPVSRSLSHVHLFILLAIATVIVITTLIYVCHRYQVLKKVFPPVPAPVIKLQSLEPDELKELQENLDPGSKKKPDDEEEMKICEIDNY